MPCRISVFSGRKRERSPCENPPNGDFGEFFAWRPFAPPGKDTTNSSRKLNAWNVAYFRVAGRKIAKRKHEKVTIWRVFAWRLFLFSPLKLAFTTWHKSATILIKVSLCIISTFRTNVQQRSLNTPVHLSYFANC